MITVLGPQYILFIRELIYFAAGRQKNVLRFSELLVIAFSKLRSTRDL
jgi:hypothetical protein